MDKKCEHVNCDEFASHHIGASTHEVPFYLCRAHFVIWIRDCSLIRIRKRGVKKC